MFCFYRIRSVEISFTFVLSSGPHTQNRLFSRSCRKFNPLQVLTKHAEKSRMKNREGVVIKSTKSRIKSRDLRVDGIEGRQFMAAVDGYTKVDIHAPRIMIQI